MKRALILLTTTFFSATAMGQAAFVSDGEAGFVLSDMKFALAPDAEKSGACPAGYSKGPGEIWALTSDGKRIKEESDQAYSQRQFQEVVRGLSGTDGPGNPCLHPEAWDPDPHFRVVTRSDVLVEGIDLDGQVTDEDFPGANGGKGIDNQFYRVTGCSKAYQSTGPENTFMLTSLSGEWGVLLTLSGVDDIENDDEIEVEFYDNNDPIQLSPDRKPLEYATYATNMDSDYRAVARGKIVDGMLTTEPVDMKFRYVINSLRLDRPLLDGRLHATLSEDGVLSGFLSGYTPIDAIYDFQYGFRSGWTGDGELAPFRLRSITGVGKAMTLLHTCQGAWHALHQHADGHRDPQTGKFTTISTQYAIEAIPAFVVHTETKSANEVLDKAGAYSRDRNY